MNKIHIVTRPGIDGDRFNSVIKGITKYNNIVSAKKIDNDTLIVAIGGDGTMLHACQYALRYDIPVLGMNFGYRGYLVDDYGYKEINEIIDEILSGNMDGLKIDERSVIATDFEKPIGRVYALNEIYVAPAAQGISIDTKVIVNGRETMNSRGSGVLVATPTGSTAFALSAGGSVMDPDSRSLQIVPLMPHTLAARPLIVSSRADIEVRWSNNIGNVYVDGRLIENTRPDAGVDGKLVVKKTSKTVKIIRPSTWNYYDNLKEKMHWYE